jgi:hypothetical protein
MIPPLAAIDSGWAAAIGTLILAVGTVAGLLLEQRRRKRVDAKADAVHEAEAPALELTATSKAAEAIARAAASLIAPFQQTIADNQREMGVLREAVRVVTEREAECQAELARYKTKLTEVTNHLGLDPPNGRDEPEHRRRSTD